MKLQLQLAASLLAASTSVAADDWPQWRGPDRDGRSEATGLLQAWPEGGPDLAWTATGLGAGFSTVAVAGDRVYTMGDLEDGQYVFALERSGGALAWRTKIGPIWADASFPGPRSTPTVDGDRVFALGTEGDLVSLDAATGEEGWRRSLRRDLGGAQMLAQGTTTWKYSESVLVDGDRVIATPGSSQAALVAFDKKSGEELWRTALPRFGEAGVDGAGYSSVVVSEACGVRQYVQLLGRGVVGVDADTGRFLWGYDRVANEIANIATPLVREDLVFASTGYNTGSALLKLECEGETGVTAREVYFLEHTRLQNHHGGLILDGDHVYTGTGHNKGFPIAIELATGEAAWGPIRNDGRDSAAIAYADGRLYLRYQDGLVLLIEASPEGYVEHGSFTIPDVDKPSWPHPVIADGRLYLREQDRLYVYDVAARD